MNQLNETHDVQLSSWVESANNDSDFPIQNLPFAVFRQRGSGQPFRGGVAIGDQILDMAAVAALKLLTGSAQQAAEAAAGPELNTLMGLGPGPQSALRLALSRALREGAHEQSLLQSCLQDQRTAEFALPCRIGDYTDFYTSIYHARNVGKQFRPDNPLLPNYQWIPIGYHGRSSTIGISGQCFPRPIGQLKPAEASEPVVEPCKRLDYELELGIFIGQGNALGERIAITNAEQHVFGLCLFNDWSARDIQAWEYQPLGPFLSKSFASTVSPWIVTLEALAPFRISYSRPATDPQPLPYLSSSHNSQYGGLDIQVHCLIQTESMRQTGLNPARLASSNFKYSYWTIAQMVAHHSLNGCALQPGDLLGSGTQSGPEHKQAGSMLELSYGGKSPVRLPNGETRRFIEDGDRIILRGHCERPGAVRIGFGESVSTVLPAIN